MKSFGRIAIAAMLAIVPMVAAATAWANTELVPGSRLVAPYWDISDDRSTLLFLTNASRKANLVVGADIGQLNGPCNLGGGVALPGSNCGVHLEFYDKTCVNINLTIDLSKQDIDQIDLGNTNTTSGDSDIQGVRGLPSHKGWVDIDVRRAIGSNGSGHSSPGVQANVLLGTVIITDSGSDFAIAYPMASSQGSANSGGSGVTARDIVTRTNSGTANVWSGGYESFPARVFVPMFFAEGNNHGAVFQSALAIAGPAQSIAGGEAPGQNLVDINGTVIDESILIDAFVDVLDACEKAESDHIIFHWVFGALNVGGHESATDTSFVFTQQLREPYGTVCGTYPAGDVDRVPGAAAFHGGFIDLQNTALGNNFANGALQNPATNIERGLVGVLVQNTPTRGDATRLWGDCSYGTNGDGGVASSGCRREYSLVGSISHDDL